MLSEVSPALSFRSEHYPASFEGRIPKRVRITAPRGVWPDYPIALVNKEYRDMVCRFGEEYDARTNSHGAVAAIFPDGRQLGLKPDEFEVIDWYEVEANAEVKG